MMTRSLLLVLLLAGCVKEWRQHATWNPDPPWISTPLTVDWSGIDTEFDGTLVDAMSAWNHAAGCMLLVRAHDAASANVTLAPYDGTICGDLAPNAIDDNHDATAGTRRCSTTHAEVRFRVMSDIRSVFVIAEHELGHVLGLAHDRSELMNASPNLYDPSAFQAAPTLLSLPSEADGAAVGSRYCTRGR